MKIKKHLLEDIKEAKESIMEDKKLMKAMKKPSKAKVEIKISAKKAPSAIKKK
jgi:hypothetical protein